MDLKRRIDIAAGRIPADLVLKNGNIVNVLSCEIHDGDVAIADGLIVGIGQYEGRENLDLKRAYVCPGFFDGHVHIESSMMGVADFASLVSVHGTTTVVADPHEIANVMGTDGIRYILSSSKHVPIDVFVMASSCVPASRFESAGAELSASDLEPLMHDKWVLGLAEMMDYPGTVNADPGCLEKISMAWGRPVDGHCPGLTGLDLCAYVCAGVHSDHECASLAEAREKLSLGMTIMIREGSQARNLDALLPLVRPETLDRFIFVTDDKDVEDLRSQGHIDHIIRRAVAAGMNPVHAIKLVTNNPARYFGLRQHGAIAPGMIANIAIVGDLGKCDVQRVYRGGQLVAVDGESVASNNPHRPPVLRSSINVRWLEPEDFVIKTSAAGKCKVHVIEVSEGSIRTGHGVEEMPVVDGSLHADPKRDLCKIAVIERHQASGKIGLGFIRGFGLSSGAIASTVGHDSHNLIVAGTNDHDMLAAAVHLIKIRGGLCAVRDGAVLADVPLPIAGLMSDAGAETLSNQLQALHQAAASLDATLRRPFMALSFVSLSVIGSLKITDLGLVDADKFELIDLVV